MKKCGPFKEKKKIQQKLSLKDWMADLLDKDFKITVLGIPGSPVARFHCQGPEFVPWSGN